MVDAEWYLEDGIATISGRKNIQRIEKIREDNKRDYELSQNLMMNGF